MMFRPRMTAMQLRNSRRRKREAEATKTTLPAETTISMPEPTASVLFSTANNIITGDKDSEVKRSRRPFASYDPARGGHVQDDASSFQAKKLECGENIGSIGGLETQRPPRPQSAIDAITNFVLGEQTGGPGHKPPPKKKYSEINWLKNSVRNLRLPLELCMRSKVRFEGPQGSLKELNSFSPVHELTALQKRAGVVGNRREVSLKGADAAKSAFLASRLYWVYPASSLPAEALQCQSVVLSNVLSDPSRAVQQFSCDNNSHVSSQVGGGWSTFFSMRRRDWEEAFRGLFCTLRDGDIAEGEDFSFYLRCPGLSVVWCREQTEEAELVAVISRSNRALRERLRASNVEFSLPLDDRPDRDALVTDNNHVDDFSVVGIKRGQYKFQQDPPSAPYKTLLRIHGSHNVYHLFDMFLEIGSGLNVSKGGSLGQLAAINGISSSKTLDVPILLSRRPFMGGTLRFLQARLLPDKRQVEPLNGHEVSVEDKREKHHGGSDIVSILEVTGPVMPSALSEMSTAATTFVSSFMSLKDQTDWQVLLTPKIDYESAYLGFADHRALKDEFVCNIKGMSGNDPDSPSFNFGVQKHPIANGLVK